MAVFLFIDESGQDHCYSPYEVLAGLSISDSDIWKFIKEIHRIELVCFGRRYRLDGREIKATRFLNRKTFRLAAQLQPIEAAERRELAKQALDNGPTANKRQLTALAQAKLSYVEQTLELCRNYRCKVFASIVSDPDKLNIDTLLLRKDYVYLFERFYYFLEEEDEQSRGIVVFDELDKSASHLLLSQMEKYFKSTSKGRSRSRLVIPEPFFVHSDLTTGIQIVDFVAYILSWSFRVGELIKDRRHELDTFLRKIKRLRFKTVRTFNDAQPYTIWSVSVV